MTLKEFAGLFEKELNAAENRYEIVEDFMNYIVTYGIELGGREFCCIKTNEYLMSRKFKTVKTELLFWTVENGKREAVAILAVDSTVSSLKKTNIKFKGFRNIGCREVTKSDTYYAVMSDSFRRKFPTYNHLMDRLIRVRREDGSIVGESQELEDIVNIEEVTSFEKIS
jgi:hypothetical protein